jgi:hypothetical protein
MCHLAKQIYAAEDGDSDFYSSIHNVGRGMPKGAVHGCVVEELVWKLDVAGGDANRRRQYERRKSGERVSLALRYPVGER